MTLVCSRYSLIKYVFISFQTGDGPIGGHGQIVRQYVIMVLKLAVDHAITHRLPHSDITVLVIQRMWLDAMIDIVQVNIHLKYCIYL